MPAKTSDRKSVNLPKELHQSLDMESARAGKHIYQLVDEAWSNYQELTEDERTLVPLLRAMIREGESPVLEGIKNVLSTFKPKKKLEIAPRRATR